MKYNRILYLWLLLAMAVISSCIVIDPDDSAMNTDYSAQETFRHEIPVQDQTRFAIGGINGDIIIRGRAGLATVTISGEKIVRSDGEKDARNHLDELDVLISKKVNEIVVKTEQPDDTNGRSYTVHYEIEIPNDWEVYANNVNGRLEIDSLSNDVVSGLVNGDICLWKINGSVVASVTNGKIDACVDLPQEGNCKLSTVNGSINLCIPKSTSATLSANVVNGTISISDLQVGNLTNTTRSVRGVIGSGDGEITLSSLNGTIAVNGYTTD